MSLSNFPPKITLLKASPRIRFNKDGALLAVSASDNGIKILANSDGLRLLRTYENLSYDSSRASESLTKVILIYIYIYSLSHVSLSENLTADIYMISCSLQ